MLESALIWVGLKSAAPPLWQVIAGHTATKVIGGVATVYGAHVGVQKLKLEGKVKQTELVIEATSDMISAIDEAQRECDEAWSAFDTAEKRRKRIAREKKKALKEAKAEERQKLKAAGEGIKWLPGFGRSKPALESEEKPAKKAAKSAPKKAAATT